MKKQPQKRFGNVANFKTNILIPQIFKKSTHLIQQHGTRTRLDSGEHQPGDRDGGPQEHRSGRRFTLKDGKWRPFGSY